MNINWAYGNPTPGKEYMLVHNHTTWFMYCSFTILPWPMSVPNFMSSLMNTFALLTLCCRHFGWCRNFGCVLCPPRAQSTLPIENRPTHSQTIVIQWTFDIFWHHEWPPEALPDVPLPFPLRLQYNAINMLYNCDHDHKLRPPRLLTSYHECRTHNLDNGGRINMPPQSTTLEHRTLRKGFLNQCVAEFIRSDTMPFWHTNTWTHLIFTHSSCVLRPSSWSAFW